MLMHKHSQQGILGLDAVCIRDAPVQRKPLAFWVQWSVTAYAAGTVLLGRVGGAIVYHPVRELRYWLCPRQ